MVGADSLAAVFVELFDVDGDWESLEFLALRGEFVDPLVLVQRLLGLRR